MSLHRQIVAAGDFIDPAKLDPKFTIMILFKICMAAFKVVEAEYAKA